MFDTHTTCLDREATGTETPAALDIHVHAVVFAADAGFADEFYPLAVDAYERDAALHGRQRIRLYGVRADWLSDDGGIRHALFLDPELGRLCEADWAPPLRPDSVQFLCLGSREQELHRELAIHLPCPQLNPPAISELADDKAATLAGWSALGLEIPRFRLIEPGGWLDALRFVPRFPESVVKPNGGTEGQGVSYLSRADSRLAARLRGGLEECWRRGAAIVQERRDGVLFRDPEQGGLHTVALRLNLVYDGFRHRLASAFAQVGTDPDQPASCGRGGRILALGEVLPWLVARGDIPLPVDGLDPALWRNIEELAEVAASLFDGLLLVGLDALLDFDDLGRLIPVFLEANPRPAGLRHARLLSGPPSRWDQAGVGPLLWDGVEALYPIRHAIP